MTIKLTSNCGWDFKTWPTIFFYCHNFFSLLKILLHTFSISPFFSSFFLQKKCKHDSVNLPKHFWTCLTFTPNLPHCPQTVHQQRLPPINATSSPGQLKAQTHSFHPFILCKMIQVPASARLSTVSVSSTSWQLYFGVWGDEFKPWVLQSAHHLAPQTACRAN